MTRFACLLSLLFILTACATPRIPFPESELASLNVKGDITVKGEIFLINQFEEKQVGSEREVTLEPVCSYSNQWREINYLGNRSIEKADPRYEEYVLRTKTDSEGKFTISGVAPGEYHLTGIVGWRALNCSATWVVTPVTVSNMISISGSNRILEVQLTKPYTSPTVICDLYNQGDWEKEGNPF